jgi:hypothetical protein
MCAGVLLMASKAAAKCPLVSYEIRGKIEGFGTGRPLEGREVVGFFDDYRDAIGEQTTYPPRVITDSRGAFVLRGVFDSYQGYSWWGGHQCSGTPDRLEIIVFSKDQDIQRLEYGHSAWTMIRERGRQVIALPAIRLEQEP